MSAIRALQSLGLIAMAEGMVLQQNGYVPECVGVATEAADFTCRNFVPKMGVDEDVATGSIQVPLNAYWTAKLGKPAGEPLTCLQASRRGGFVRSRAAEGGSVYVGGRAALSLRGQLPVR